MNFNFAIKAATTKYFVPLTLLMTSTAMADSREAETQSKDFTSMVWVDNAVQVQMTRDGFPWMSDVISNDFLNDISDQPLPDVDEDMGGGVQGHIEGITYSIDFDRADLSPSDHSLSMKLRMKSISVKAANLNFKKKAGVTLSLKCENVELSAGKEAPINLAMNLGMTVQDGRIRLNEQSTDLDLNEDNFSISGPEKCSGQLGVGNLIRSSVHLILERSKTKIINTAKDRVRDLIPKIEDSLNQVFTTSIPVALGGTPAVPLKQAVVLGRPKSIDINSAGLTAILDVDVSLAASNLFPKDELQAQKSKRRPQNLSTPVLASAALKTDLINQLLHSLLPTLPASLPIDTQASPANQVFTRTSLAAILPDLNLIPLDDEMIHARIGFGKTPYIVTRPGIDQSIALTLQAPEVHILLSIMQKGQEVPYFDLIIDASFGLRLAHDPDTKIIQITPEKPSTMHVSGHWAPAYVPVNDSFEQDIAQVIFTSTVEYLMVAHPIVRVVAPTIAIDPSHALDIAYPFVTADSIGIALHNR